MITLNCESYWYWYSVAEIVRDKIQDVLQSVNVITRDPASYRQTRDASGRAQLPSASHRFARVLIRRRRPCIRMYSPQTLSSPPLRLLPAPRTPAPPAENRRCVVGGSMWVEWGCGTAYGPRWLARASPSAALLPVPCDVCA